jgi:NADH:ubiquinone oxidoreductase subunit K
MDIMMLCLLMNAVQTLKLIGDQYMGASNMKTFTLHIIIVIAAMIGLGTLAITQLIYRTQQLVVNGKHTNTNSTIVSVG